MCYYVYADHAQYTIKTYAKMSLFALDLTGPLSIVGPTVPACAQQVASYTNTVSLDFRFLNTVGSYSEIRLYYGTGTGKVLPMLF